MIWIVVAARNEQHNIDAVVRAAAQYGRVVVVDNASWDATAQYAREAGATAVIEHERDTHIKQSYVDGFRYALTHGASWVIQLDAGLSFDPYQIPHLWRIDADLVIGQRPNKSRKQISLAGGLLTRLITGMPYRDATSGFRCWKASALQRLDLDALTCRAHGFQIELLWQAWKMGLDIETVNVSYRPGRTSANWNVAREALGATWRMRRYLTSR